MKHKHFEALKTCQNFVKRSTFLGPQKSLLHWILLRYLYRLGCNQNGYSSYFLAFQIQKDIWFSRNRNTWKIWFDIPDFLQLTWWLIQWTIEGETSKYFLLDIWMTSFSCMRCRDQCIFHMFITDYHPICNYLLGPSPIIPISPISYAWLYWQILHF